jgi:hypothetical protein
MLPKMNKEITEYIEQSPAPQREIMQTIRVLIHETVKNTQESFKWSRPVFGTNKDFAYLKTAKSYVTLGFMNYKLIEDPQNKLEGTGKDMRHIKIKKAEDIDKKELIGWLKAISGK